MSTAVLREVRLYGALGRQFGRVFRLAVSSPAEAAQALRAVLPGFAKAFVGPDGKQAYHVYVGRGQQRRDVGEEEAAAPIGRADVIRFVPVMAGAKRAGTTQTIVGYILFAVGVAINFYYPGAGNSLIAIGESMMLSGIIQMLSPQRVGKDTSRQDTPSYAFDGPVNSTQQGGPVPLIFGRVICGSTVVSQGLTSDDIVASPTGTLTPVTLPDYEPLDPSDPGGE